MSKTITPKDLREAIVTGKEMTIFDVRRKTDFDADPRMIVGAAYRDPEQVEQWSSDLREGREVVVYCVRGGSVSRSVAEKLQAKKIRVSFLEGGIAAWKEFGGEVQEGN